MPVAGNLQLKHQPSREMGSKKKEDKYLGIV